MLWGFRKNQYIRGISWKGEVWRVCRFRRVGSQQKRRVFLRGVDTPNGRYDQQEIIKKNNQRVVYTNGSFIFSHWAFFWMGALLKTIVSYHLPGLFLTIQGKTEAYMNMPLLFLLVLTVGLRLSSQVLIQLLICLTTLHKSWGRLMKKVKIYEEASVGFLTL